MPNLQVIYYNLIAERWQISSYYDNRFDSVTSLLNSGVKTWFKTVRWSDADKWHPLPEGISSNIPVPDNFSTDPPDETYEAYIERTTMPRARRTTTIQENNVTSTAAVTPAPNAPLVDIRIARENGVLTLNVNAQHLHALLDSVGCRTNSRGLYEDQPTAAFSVIENHQLSTMVLLRKEYPVKVHLNQIYNSRPPTMENLKKICESGHAAVKAILAHYQPVDIRYTIQKLLK